MAEAATAAPPAPSSAPASPPPAAPSSAPPISVTTAAIDSGPKSPPPKPGSARDRMFSDLRKKVGAEEETPPVTSPKPTESPDAPPEGGEASTATESPAPAGDKGKAKVSPWKLVDEHKAARLKAETELADLRKSMVDPAKVKEIETKAESAERRARELDEEIKYVNYSKSREFAEKYQKPYDEAWHRWMGELSELTVQDPSSGNERPIAPTDLLDLVNLPLKEAKAKAMEQFGDFADDAMSARKEIRGLFEAQHKALEEAKKNGELRETERTRATQEYQQKLGAQINDLWAKSNEMAQADERFGKHFKPVEGDEEANTRLKKGFEIADKAFSVNPLDPKLTPDQRQQIVQLHSAVRNRAAAFGRLVYQLEKSDATIAELKAALDKFKEAQPGAGEPRDTTAPNGSTSARGSVLEALRKIAH